MIRSDAKLIVCGGYQSGKTTWARWLLAQCPRVFAFDPVWEGLTENTSHDLGQSLALLQQHGRSCFQPSDAEASFDAFCGEALKLSNTVVAIDEASLVLNSRGSMPPNFSRLFRLGHKRGCGLVLVTHRISGDLPALTRLVPHVIIFKTTLNNDLEVLADFIGPAGVEQVKALRPYEWLHWSPDGLRKMPPVKVS